MHNYFHYIPSARQEQPSGSLLCNDFFFEIIGLDYSIEPIDLFD